MVTSEGEMEGTDLHIRDGSEELGTYFTGEVGELVLLFCFLNAKARTVLA